ncbi:MAG: LamG domain-containing protein [Chitinophagaceae bacterium]|nr:LamG domain-containing protein [Chitinophagaceae bacterium]
MDRPELGEFERDPDPPPYNELKSQFTFDESTNDGGENALEATETKNVTWVDGVSGKAARIGAGGYILYKAIGDTVTFPNNFKSVPADTLANLGSFTLAFWMNGVGPVAAGAQGLFSISHKAEFWGNLDLFLENYPDGGDTGFLKVHMFNAGVSSGNGEEWNELKIPGILNKWTHIAVVYNEKTSLFNLYADGVAVIPDKQLGGGNYGKVKFSNFNGMVVGNYQFQTTPSLTNHGPESWAQSFDGAIDNLRLYNRALSTEEINQLVTGHN